MTVDEYKQSVRVFTEVIERLMHQSFQLIDEIESFSQVGLLDGMYLKAMGIDAIIEGARETEIEALPLVGRFLNEPIPIAKPVEAVRTEFLRISSFMSKVADFLCRVYERIIPRTEALQALKLQAMALWLDWLRVGRTTTWLDCEIGPSMIPKYAKLHTAYLHLLRIIQGSLDSMKLTDGSAMPGGVADSLRSKIEEARRSRLSLLSVIQMNIGEAMTGMLTSPSSMIVSLRSFVRQLQAILEEFPTTLQYGDFKFVLIRGCLELRISEYQYLADELALLADENSF